MLAFCFPACKKTRCMKNSGKDSMTRDERAGTTLQGLPPIVIRTASRNGSVIS